MTDATPCPACNDAGTEHASTCDATRAAPSRRRSDRRGLVAGRYALGRLLGRGAFSEVFEAEDMRLRRQVALKLLRAEVSLEELEREGRILARLHHRNVVAVHDLVHDGPDLGISMEIVQGSSMAALLQGAALPWTRAVAIVSQVATGLDHAHQRGVVHGDVKPSNVLVGEDGVAKVSDFGTARLMESRTSGTASLAGTMAYTAPEIFNGSRADARTDIYSLGVLAFEALAGRRPFHAETAQALVACVLRDAPPGLGGDVPAALEAVVHRCLAKPPGSRPASCAEVAAALTSLLPRDQQPDDWIAVPRELRADLVPSATTGERRRVVSMAISRRHLDELAEEWPASRVNEQRLREDQIILDEARRHAALVGDLGPTGARLVFGLRRRGEGDAASAIDCAMALRARLAAAAPPDIESRFSFAIHLVPATSLAPGAPWSMQSRGMAELVALAAASADGVIVTSGPVRAGARHRYGFRAGPAVASPEGRHTLAAWTVDSEGQPEDVAIPLMGRAHELGLILEAAEAAQDGDALLVTLHGPPGIGKSRLLEEAVHRLATGGWTRLHVEGLPPYRQPAGHPFRELLLQLRESGAWLRTAARLCVSDAAILETLMNGPQPDAGARDESVREREAALRVAWTRCCVAVAAESPLLIAIEDAHELDASALRTLWAVVEGSSRTPVLVLASHRGDLDATWTGSPSHRDIRLAALPTRHVADLVRSVLGGEGAAAVDRIVEQAEGNPLLALELARTLVERLRSEAEGSGLGAEPEDWPPSLREAVASRLDHLESRSRLLLHVGSVMGREFPLGVAELVLAREGVAAEAEALALEPCRRQLLEVVSRDGRRVGRFQHELVRDVVYEQLLRARQRQLHGAVAEALGETSSAAGSAVQDLMAHHLVLAGRPADALPHFDSVVTGLLAAGDYRGALLRVRAALEVQGEGRDRDSAERLLRAVTLELQLDEHAPAQAHARTALAMARQLSDSRLVGLALLRLAAAAHVQNREDEALAAVQEGLALARECGDGSLEVKCLIRLASIRRAMGDTVGAVAALSTAEADAREGDLEDVLREQARLLYATGEHAESVVRTDAALDRATRRCDFPARSNLLAQRSAALLALGRFDEAVNSAQEALAIARESAGRLREAYCLSLLAHVALQQHQPRVAERHATEAVALAREMGEPRDLGIALRTRALALHDLGRFDEALALLADALDEPRLLSDARFRTFLLLAHARVSCTLGDWDAAIAHAERAAEMAEAQGDTLRKTEACVLLSEASRGAGKIDPAREALQGASHRHLSLVVFEDVRLTSALGEHDEAASKLRSWSAANPDAATMEGAALELLWAEMHALDADARRECARSAVERADADGLTDPALLAASVLETLGERAEPTAEARLAAACSKLSARSAAMYRARVRTLGARR